MEDDTGSIPADSAPESLSPPINKRKFDPRLAFWTFLVGCSVGAVVEFFFRAIMHDVIDYRANLVLSPFLVIYGFGTLVMYFGSLINAHKNVFRMFIYGFIACSLLEYASSLVAEYAFGVRTWNYSYMRFHINGRVSLQHAVYWGALAVAWYLLMMPTAEKLLGKIPRLVYKRLTMGLAIYVTVDVIVTIAAFTRWNMRLEGIPPSSFIGEVLDAVFSDGYMSMVFAGIK